MLMRWTVYQTDTDNILLRFKHSTNIQNKEIFVRQQFLQRISILRGISFLFTSVNLFFFY